MMLYYYFIIPTFIYMIGIMTFISHRKHLLSMLLVLEYIVLCLFYTLFLWLLYFNYEMYFSMFFLVFSVCEGALGLAILVSLVRTHGNDYFQSFSIL